MSGSDRLRILQPAQDKAVADLLLKLLKRLFPVSRDGRGLDIDGTGVPAQRLLHHIAEIIAWTLMPGAGSPTCLQRDRTAFPNVLGSSLNNPLRIKVQHVSKRVARPTHIAPTIEPPPGSTLSPIGQHFDDVKVHQQTGSLEHLEKNVD